VTCRRACTITAADSGALGRTDTDARIVRHGPAGTAEIVGGLDLEPSRVVTHGEHTVWLSRGEDFDNDPASIMLLSESCGGEPVARVTDVDSRDALLLDGKTLYWGIQAGAIFRMALDADEPETFARGHEVGGVVLAVDDDSVYWGQFSESGVVRRAAK
jgi:hypothetical protein